MKKHILSSISNQSSFLHEAQSGLAVKNLWPCLEYAGSLKKLSFLVQREEQISRFTRGALNLGKWINRQISRQWKCCRGAEVVLRETH